MSRKKSRNKPQRDVATEQTSAAINSGDGSSQDASKEAAPKTNDVEWYAKDPQLLLNASQIPFSDSFGSRVNLYPKNWKFYNYGNSETSESHAVEFRHSGSNTISGIMTLNMRPTFGENNDRNDPLNVAAMALYTHVRYNNSGRKNYEQADLMMYMCAMADIYSYIFWLQRIYNCAFMLSQRNYYVGDALLRAQRVDYKDVTEHLANFRYGINLLINKISSFVIPNSIELFRRRAFMYSNIYIDNPDGNIKDQMYLFNPDGFHIFTYDEDHMGTLRYTPLDRFADHPAAEYLPLTVAQLLHIGNEMLRNIYGDEDWGLMSGDLLRSFAGNLIGLQTIPEEGIIMPIYDINVLHQIKNATVMGERNYWSDKQYGNTNMKYYVRKSLTVDTKDKMCYYGDLCQDGLGNLHSRYAYKKGTQIAGTPPKYSVPATSLLFPNVIISTDVPIPTPADVVEATRLMCTKSVNDDALFQDGSCFSTMIPTPEYVYSIQTWNYRYNNDTEGSRDLVKQEYYGNIFSDNLDEIQKLWRIARYNMFHHAPILYYLQFSISESDVIDDVLLVTDVNNYTVQAQEVISRLNEVAWLSLVYVPGISKMIN